MINPQDYWKLPTETVDQYNQRIASLRAADTQAQQNTNYQDIFSKAGGAGVSFNDLSKLTTPSQADTQGIQDSLAKQYGYPDFNAFIADVFQKPSKTTEQLYNEAYNAAGLPDLINQLTTKKNQLNTATGNISENPWLDEASRFGRVKRLQDLANGDISNLQGEYDLKLQQVHDLVTQHAQDFANNQQLNQARLNYLLQQAEQRAQQKQAETFQKYLPDYLKSVAPNTVTLPDGSLATWDSQQNAFVPVNITTNNSITADASQLAAAIRQAEGGNYNAKGASGEFGAYQFMPSTWSQWSKEYLVATEGSANRSLAPTPENQDAVATFKIQQLLNQGYTPSQIASIWNSGSPDPTGKIGTNSKGVAYNTPEYVKRVLGILSQGSNQAPKLSKAAQTRVDAYTDDFKQEPIVKQFNDVQNKYLSMQQIINAGVGGPGDLSLVYDFMKALDPTSVVRESEYASAAKSGNIFAGTLARFNGYLKEQGGILPEQVKQAFLDIVSKKFDVATQQYRNLRSEYARKINDVQGVNGSGERYLVDYEKAGSIGSTTNSYTVTAPNGVTYAFPNEKALNQFKKQAHIQ
jgi:muramidase (phage lysozyme)